MLKIERIVHEKLNGAAPSLIEQMEVINRCKAGFYQWVQKDIEREVSSDLYLLRQIKGHLAITSCCYLDTLQSDEMLGNLKSLSNKFLQGENGVVLGDWTQLRYLHSVQYDDGSSDMRQRVVMTDFLRCLGLGETTWEYMTDEDIPNAANVLGELCSNFMEGIEKIISDAVNY